MTKDDYIKLINENYENESKEMLLKQVELFFTENNFSKNKYNIGDNVVLKKGTYIHGIPGYLDNFDWIIENGFIGNDFTNRSVANKIKSSIGMWRIKEDILLKDYVNNYSGFTIVYTIGRGPGSKEVSELIPYHKFDEYTEKINDDENIWMYWGDQTKEVRFLPSLVANKRQLAFILNMENALAKELVKLDFKWIRFLYAYPESITDELIETVKQNDKICNYFDIPIQHISDSVLKRMNRRTTGKKIEDLIIKIKKEIPDAVLRTSLIVGFPGETEEDFEKLYSFVKKGYFGKLGVFMYSKEDGTPAARLKDQIHHNTKKKRHNKIMSVAREISNNNLQSYIGKTYEVLIENVTFDNKFYIGRSYMDIPETDGTVIIRNTKDNLVGKFIKCKITNINNYDLIAEIN